MPRMPQGFVTFLFTDIEGSTRLWEERTEAMWETLQQHDLVMRKAIESAEGYVFKTVGDAFCASFSSVRSALDAAIAAQQAIFSDPLLNGEKYGFAVRVRMGLHSGEPMSGDNDYFGPVVNRAARVAGIANGGQVVLSSLVSQLLAASLPPDITFKELGLCRLKGLEEPELLFQVMHPDLPANFPPLPSPFTSPNNLPAQVTAFIGRSQELQALEDLLAAKKRLITILGPGGAGKTRLALQVAFEVLDRYPGGVWWVDLTTLTGAAQVLPAIAGVFGLTEASQRPLMEQVIERLKGESTLLVLDNFEQVTDAASDVDRLLRLCSGLKVLVTSRSLLNLSAEQEFPLAEMSPEEAVQLFVLRVQQNRPNFTLDDSNRPIVERIIRRLDFNPLSLELAAAQTRLLTVAQIEKQLSQRFRLLVSPYRDVSQRQKTLRAALDWGYDILAEEEQELFLQLSAFAGRFMLEDVEAVTGDEGAILGIMRLRDQSLLRMEDSEDNTIFYMQESLREYGIDRLRSAHREDAVCGNMAGYFARLAKDQSDNPSDNGYTRLLFHRDNLRASLEWLLSHNEWEAAGNLCLSLRTLWQRQGAFREGRDYILRVLAGLPPTQLKADLLRRAGALTFHIGDYKEADSLLQQSQHLYRDLTRDYEAAIAQNERALIAKEQGRFDEARTLFLESLRYAEQKGDEPRQAGRLSNLGLLEISAGRFDEARTYLHQALSIYQRRGDTEGMAVCLCNLSDLALAAHSYEEAAEFARQSEAQSRCVQDWTGVLFALVNLAQAESHLGKRQDVLRAVQQALPYCRETEQFALVRPLLRSLLTVLVDHESDPSVCSVAAALERTNSLLSTPPDDSDIATSVRLGASYPTELQAARQMFEKAGWEEIISRMQQ